MRVKLKFSGFELKFGLFLAAALFFSSLAFAQAQEGGMFNFGTMQPSKLITVEPGQSAIAKIYVFNVHGNRPTHVQFGISESAPGFTITLLPALHSASYNISGVLKTIDENMVVDPVKKEELPLTKPLTAEEGMEWIPIGGIDGFVPAKVLYVNVTADASLPLWTDYGLKVTALANWFDIRETGPVGVGQSREFDYTIRTATFKYSEEAVETSKPSTPLDTWFYAFLGLAAVFVIVLGYMFFTRKPSKPSKTLRR
jgi:hypothetical protein